MRAREEGREGVEDDVESHLVEVARGQDGRAAALDHVGDERAANLGSDPAHLRPGLRGLDERGVGAELAAGAGARDGLVKAHRRACVGAGNNDKVARGSRVKGRPELFGVLCILGDLLACHVAAPLWPALVLEEHSSSACPLEALDEPPDAQRVAIARVGVYDDRCAGGAADSRRVGDGLAGADKAIVGQAEHRGRRAIAGLEHRLKAGKLRQARTERVIDAGDDEAGLARYEAPNAGCHCGRR